MPLRRSGLSAPEAADHKPGDAVTEPAAAGELQLRALLGNPSAAAALVAAPQFVFEQENHAATWLNPECPD